MYLTTEHQNTWGKNRMLKINKNNFIIILLELIKINRIEKLRRNRKIYNHRWRLQHPSLRNGQIQQAEKQLRT